MKPTLRVFAAGLLVDDLATTAAPTARCRARRLMQQSLASDDPLTSTMVSYDLLTGTSHMLMSSTDLFNETPARHGPRTRLGVRRDARDRGSHDGGSHDAAVDCRDLWTTGGQPTLAQTAEPIALVAVHGFTFLYTTAAASYDSGVYSALEARSARIRRSAICTCTSWPRRSRRSSCAT